MGQTEYTLTTSVLGNLLFQGVVVSFASLLLWFWLQRQYLASQIGVFTFMTPVFGVCFSVWLLLERVEKGFVLAASLALLGLLIMSCHQTIQKRWRVLLQDT